MMSRLRRFIAVNAGLVAAGAVAGAVTGTAVIAVATILTLRPYTILVKGPILMMFAAPVGAAFGAVAAPLLGWLVLRPVPLGRAFGWAAAGTLIGATIGMVFRINPFIAGPCGTVAASIAARFYTRRRAQRLATPEKKLSAEI